MTSPIDARRPVASGSVLTEAETSESAADGESAPEQIKPGESRSWLGRTSLRVKLIFVVVSLSALVLAMSGVVATTALRGFLHSQLDDRLKSAASQVASQLRFEQNIFSPPGFFVDVLDADGDSVVTRQTALPADVPDLDGIDLVAVADRDGAIVTVPSVLSGGSDWRVLARSVDSEGPGRDEVTQTLVVATSRGDVDKTVQQLVSLLIGIGLVALLALALVGSLVIRRSLRPLEEIESVAGDIAAGDLTRRVPDPDARTEVGRLAGALNGMLARIEAAVRDREAAATAANQSEQRMRRFVADASHELRTPLTSIRGFAELYRQGAVPDGPDTGRAMARIESEAGRMNVLVEDMLLLARLDERRPVQLRPVDMLPLAVDAVYDARAVAPDRVIDLIAGEGLEPMVLGDELRLRQVLGNIVANALVHTPPATPVQVRVRVAGDSVIVEVADRGPGLDEEQAARVFERFYRADPARSRAGAEAAAGDSVRPGLNGLGGNGLGLAIVAAIAAAHNGRVEVDSAPGAGATFRVVLPYAPAQAMPDGPGSPETAPSSAVGTVLGVSPGPATGENFLPSAQPLPR